MAFIRLRKATDRKFITINTDHILTVEDATGKLTAEGPDENLTLVFLVNGNGVPVEESQNVIRKLLDGAE